MPRVLNNHSMKDFLDQYLNNCSKHYAAHIQQDIVPITSKALIGKATETVFHQLQQLPELDNKQFTITNGHIQLLNGHVFNEQETQTLSTQLKAFRPWRR